MVKVGSWLIPMLISAGMIPIGIVGSFCLATNNYDSCFNSQGSAILMEVGGYILGIFFFCIGLYLFSRSNKKETFERL